MKIEMLFTDMGKHVGIISGVNLGRGYDAKGFYVCQITPEGYEETIEQAKKESLLLIERLLSEGPGNEGEAPPK